ncbi:MAG: hypothetical protein LBB65_01405 [Burkholderiales bacterium]|jgi:hypothetical protein|nr:hypothetical protein [Burkholderiales bacterium]
MWDKPFLNFLYEKLFSKRVYFTVVVLALFLLAFLANESGRNLLSYFLGGLIVLLCLIRLWLLENKKGAIFFLTYYLIVFSLPLLILILKPAGSIASDGIEAILGTALLVEYFLALISPLITLLLVIASLLGNAPVKKRE